MNQAPPDAAQSRAAERHKLVAWIRKHYEARDVLRRAATQFRAGRFDDALALFERATELGADGTTLAGYLADSDLLRSRCGESADTQGVDPAGSVLSVADRVRLACAHSTGGRVTQAIHTLRDGLRMSPDAPELHFHLGLMCAEHGDHEEAELRFAQVLSIKRDHVDSMVHLGLCRGAVHDLAGAIHWLQRAQARRPDDARIGILITQAAKALNGAGAGIGYRPTLCTIGDGVDAGDIEQLAAVVEADPEFVDAFLALSKQEVNQEVLAILLQTLQVALERQPEHAELHHHCGRVHNRLGRSEAAIAENERAVAIDPGFTRALIELGRLYHTTNRNVDAVARLESALRAGADYADVHFLLGSMYRDLGQTERARHAFRRALKLNCGYAAAQEALTTLAGS